MRSHSKKKPQRSTTAPPQRNPFAPPTIVQAKADPETAELPQWKPGTPATLPNLGQNPTGIPAIQTKLTIGQPNDKYEQEADRVASQVVQTVQQSPDALQTDTLQREDGEQLQMKPQLQRQAVSGEVSPELEQNLNRAKSGGQSLNPQIQAKMGAAMGADFSGVKIHTDAQSDQLNQAIQAKAFTTGQDVFFRQGEYNPGSRNGQQLIAHELTHVVQQNSVAPKTAIHPTPPNQTMVQGAYHERSRNEYYSHALKGQKLTKDRGVISVCTTENGLTGGHAILYIERLVPAQAGNEWEAESMKLDLWTVDDGDGVAIRNFTAQPLDLRLLSQSTRRKSWVLSNNSIQRALNEADRIKQKNENDPYTYAFIGASLSPMRKGLNCARYVEKVLQAAGVGENIAGKVFKIPSKMIEGDDFGHEPNEAHLNRLKQYEKLPQSTRNITFEKGIKVVGSTQREGKLNTRFEFTDRDNPAPDEISINIKEILIEKIEQQSACARLEEADKGERYLYISLESLFDFSGRQPELITKNSSRSRINKLMPVLNPN